jgi:enamine deaminase RidA (YjgF/YER057c/UK114 family)
VAARTRQRLGNLAFVTLIHVSRPAGVAPGNGYSHVVYGAGRLVAVAGQIALDERGELVGRDDAAAQARQVFLNLGRCLAEAGATFEDVVKLTYYVLDVADLPVVRLARDAVINTARPPASTAVQVAALVAPEFLVEIDAFAVVADRSPND